MLATIAERPFDDPAWIYEIKWDGYRAISYIADGKVRLVSRNQNDLTAQFHELSVMPKLIRAKTAVIDGEIVALDESGRASFSLMQQRTGIRSHGHRVTSNSTLPIQYYAFDLLYLDGYDLRRTPLESRKQMLASIIAPQETVRYSEHFPGGIALFKAAQAQGLEGILAKCRDGAYQERRSREWLKIKITSTVDCVIGGYTDPEGTRQFFGSLILGLYDKKGQLIHVGQVGTGFNHGTLKAIFGLLKENESAKNPFHGPVDARHNHWTKPVLVAEIKFSEWTHGADGGEPKLRAPVFVGLREDKRSKECTFADQGS
jgi:bifunctional non-homologous end joining protein LigD